MVAQAFHMQVNAHALWSIKHYHCLNAKNITCMIYLKNTKADKKLPCTEKNISWQINWLTVDPSKKSYFCVTQML